MRAAILVLLAACGSSRSAPDAGCDPGVRLHLTFASDETGNAVNRDSLGLRTTGADGGLQSTTWFQAPLDANHEATVILRYPAGTLLGPATVSYYAILANMNFEGSTDFVADPGACVDVDLSVTQSTIGAADGG